jgi:hypothetical protein
VVVVEREPQRTVNAWLERRAGHSTLELIRAFEAAFTALWQRVHLTLGEVTLGAIVERVLHNATEQYPVLASIEITTAGLRCESLETQTGLRHGDVADAVRFVLVELLTVLGNLTGQILTPALHAELSKDHPVATDRATEDSMS